MTMLKKNTVLAALLILPTLAGSALAAGPDELRYDYIDLGLTFGSVDTAGDDPDFTSFDVGGSWGVHQNFALFAGLSVGEIDTTFGNIDTTALSLGINPHFALSDRIDLVIPVAIEFADIDAGIASDDDTGYSIGIGIRALLSPSWELGVGVQHVDIFDGDDQSIAGSVRWHLSSLFSLSLGATASDDASALVLNGRFSF